MGSTTARIAKGAIVNEPRRDIEVEMSEVYRMSLAHVQTCGSGDCPLCVWVADRLLADPRRGEWEAAERKAAEEEGYRRQLAHEQNEERKDAL